MKSLKLLSQALTVAIIAAWLASLAKAAEEHVVEFRLASWKTEHIDGAQKAAEQEKTLKKLGCEVKVGAHAGHHDVTYRCPQWRRLAAESDASAHRWEAWLKSRGFETKHVH